MQRSWWVVLGCFVWACVPAVGAAQAPSEAGGEAYHAAIDKALGAYNAGQWTEARVLFGRAHSLQPSARTLRGMGLASYESRQYVDAIEYLEQAMQSRVHPLTPQMRALAEQLIAESRQFVTRVRVVLSPARASLRVDGKPARYADDGAVLLDPGSHELLAFADDFKPLRRRVESQGGRELRVRMVLRRKPGYVRGNGETALARADSRQVVAPEPASREIAAPWIVVGGAVSLVAAVSTQPAQSQCTQSQMQ